VNAISHIVLHRNSPYRGREREKERERNRERVREKEMRAFKALAPLAQTVISILTETVSAVLNWKNAPNER